MMIGLPPPPFSQEASRRRQRSKRRRTGCRTIGYYVPLPSPSCKSGNSGPEERGSLLFMAYGLSGLAVDRVADHKK